MITTLSAKDLIEFEAHIASEFNAGKIPHPVHLQSGCEDKMLDMFSTIGRDDYVCGGWRMHMQCLLKGVPKDMLYSFIHSGHSISLCFPEYRIYSSAIVGGILPIALGIALGIRLQKGGEMVHCWIGDMTAKTGIYKECETYAEAHGLPIRFIKEDNGLSVQTPTQELWKSENRHLKPEDRWYLWNNKYPHVGAGEQTKF